MDDPIIRVETSKRWRYIEQWWGVRSTTLQLQTLIFIGSIAIDADLPKAADILPFERVQAVDANNGNRLEIYAIEGAPGRSVIQLNGAAAHLGNVGDLVVIISYGQLEEPLPEVWWPTVVLVDEKNALTEVRSRRKHGDTTGC